MIHVGRNHEYIGRCLVYHGHIMGTWEGYHEYIRGYSIMIHSGHTMSTLQGYLEGIRVIIQYIRGVP